MNPAKPDWLAQLAPAHAPPPPGWWPLAPGWWGGGIIILVAMAGFAYRQTRPSVRLRRIALRELDKLSALECDERTLANCLEDLLRRYAVARYGREVVANLSGERWIAFVVSHGGSALAGKAGADLLCAAYGGKFEVDRIAWLSGARMFIKEGK